MNLKARRSSLLKQWTSTPRLSMTQKVKRDLELLKRRRISLLNPDDVTSSESDNNAYGTPGTGEGDCDCKSRRASRAKVARRDSLIFNSPVARKKKTTHPSRAIYDRSAINRLQKQKRQTIFNKARDMLATRESEPGTNGRGSTHLESLQWDGQFDLISLGADVGDFDANNEQLQKKFQEIILKERCDADDLFTGEVNKLVLIQDDDEGDEDLSGNGHGHRVEVSIERQAEEPIESPLRSFEKSGASTVPSKSYSMNSGVYWGNERIPTASIVHFSPRSERVTITPDKSGGVGGMGINLRSPLSQENLLQLIVVVLFGILLCVVYQSVMY